MSCLFVVSCSSAAVVIMSSFTVFTVMFLIIFVVIICHASAINCVHMYILCLSVSLLLVYSSDLLVRLKMMTHIKIFLHQFSDFDQFYRLCDIGLSVLEMNNWAFYITALVPASVPAVRINGQTACSVRDTGTTFPPNLFILCIVLPGIHFVY